MAMFRVYNGRDLVGEYFFHHGPVTIGRHPRADIFLKEDAVSRHHAVLNLNGDSWSIENKSGRNGVFVNQKFTNFQMIESGDRIKIGRTIIQFTDASGKGEEVVRFAEDPAAAALASSLDELMTILEQDQNDDEFVIFEGTTAALQTISLDHDEYGGDDFHSSSRGIQTDSMNDQTSNHRAHLSWDGQNGEAKYLPIRNTDIVLGRGVTAAVQVRGGLGIGNRFAVVQRAGHYVIIDRTSLLVAVRVNGAVIKSATRLSHGDRIMICDTELVFHSAASEV